MELDWSKLPAEYQTLRHNIVEVPQIDISAREIRRRVAEKHRLPDPARRLRLHRDHGLYRP